MKIFCVVLVVFILTGCATVGDLETRGNYPNTDKNSDTNTQDARRGEKGLPSLDENSSLEDYLTYATLNNPGLKAAFNSWKAALEKIPQVSSLPDPRFTYGYFLEEVETRVGSQQQKFAIAQMFPWFGKLPLKGKIALEMANAQRAKFEAQKLVLAYRVKNVFYEYYYLGRAIAITEDNVRLLTYLEGVARTAYTAGKARYGDVIKAQVEMGKLEDRLLTLNDLRVPIVAKLRSALGCDEEIPFPFPKAISEKEILYGVEEIQAFLKESNPNLQALDFMIDKERASIKLAGKNYFPDVTFGLEYIDTSDTLMPMTDDSGKDPIIAKVSVNLPIWRKKYRAGEEEARFRFEAATEQRLDKENNLVADLKMALYKFQDAQRKINLYKDTLIPKAEQTLNVAEKAFSVGKMNFLDVIDAQRMLLEFQLLYERALTNTEQRIAELEMLSATDLSGGAEEHGLTQTNTD